MNDILELFYEDLYKMIALTENVKENKKYDIDADCALMITQFSKIAVKWYATFLKWSEVIDKTYHSTDLGNIVLRSPDYKGVSLAKRILEFKATAGYNEKRYTYIFKKLTGFSLQEGYQRFFENRPYININYDKMATEFTLFGEIVEEFEKHLEIFKELIKK